MAEDVKVLVTGSSGFIGRWVCDLLEREGFTVLGLDVLPKPVPAGKWQSITCDLLKFSDVNRIIHEHRPSHVLHLAARTDLDGASLTDYAVNIDGVHNLVSAIEGASSVKRAVFTSSQLVCKVGHVPREQDEYLPDTVYGHSKVETERIVRARSGGSVTWCLVRPTTVWGPHMSKHYSSLLQYIEDGIYFHSGGGALLKSYAYAGNIAYQYMRILFADAEQIDGKVFYLADYEPISLRDYVNALADELGVKRPVTLPLYLARVLAWIGDVAGTLGRPQPFNSFRLRNIRTEYVFDTRSTEQVCGPLPFTFEDGITDSIFWYKSNYN
jgi:nucleoside-diphosphate-sugar epimerase